VRLLATATLAVRSSRCYRSYMNLLVSCFFVTDVVKNLATLIPGYIVALLVFLDMLTCVNIFVALSLFLASSTCVQGGFVIKKGGQQKGYFCVCGDLFFSRKTRQKLYTTTKRKQ
jgi:hypothetical protein